MTSSPGTVSRYEELFHISDQLESCLELEPVLKRLPGYLRRIAEFDYLGVLLDGELVGSANLYATRGHHPLVETIEEKAAQTARAIVSRALTQRRIVFLPNGEPELDPVARRWLTSLDLRSGIVIPLETAARKLGGVLLGSSAPTCGSEGELRFLTSVGRRIALALERVFASDATGHRLEFALPMAQLGEPALREQIVGSSAAIRRVMAQASKVAPEDATVLITGETGTGKELVAHSIHNQSARAGNAFIHVNCAAIPPSLVASELFGFEKGAFTGAEHRHIGRLESAHQGTIFLDEIGDMPIDTQITLLRVLQERELDRLGGTRPVPVDLRVIAATNCDLPEAVSAGKFRSDLFYRLNVFPIDVPPLRERREDIVLLTEYFVCRFAKRSGRKVRRVAGNTLDLLQSYDWPGNICELQNVLERAVILCDDGTLSIERSWLQPDFYRHPKPFCESGGSILESYERDLIETALKQSRGRVSGPNGAAIRLGLPRTTLESKIKSLNINKRSFQFPDD